MTCWAGIRLGKFAAPPQMVENLIEPSGQGFKHAIFFINKAKLPEGGQILADNRRKVKEIQDKKYCRPMRHPLKCKPAQNQEEIYVKSSRSHR
jgi:hypothetical protein